MKAAKHVTASGRTDAGGASVEFRAGPSQRKRLPEGRSVAVLDVEGSVVKLRVVAPMATELPAPLLSQAEAQVLTAGSPAPPPRAAGVSAAALTAASYGQVVESSLSVEEASERLAVNASRVRQRLADRSLYGIKTAGTWHLPAFQFLKRGLVPGIEAVLKALPSDVNVLAVVRWFETPNADLCTRDDDERPLTPLEWLAGGYVPDAAAALASEL